MNDWKMTYGGPQLMLPFAYGEVQVTFTNAGHCHVSAYSRPDSRPGTITFKGTTWYASVHLFAASGWRESRHEDGHFDYREDYRHIPSSAEGRDMAPSYRVKVVAALTSAVAAFVQAHPLILTEAERNSQEHKLESTQKKIAELQGELNGVLAAQDVILARLAEIGKD